MTNCNEINIEAGRLKSIFGKCYNLKAIDLRDVVDLIESVNSCANGSFQLKTVNGQSLFGSGNIVVTATVDGTETKLQQGTGISITGLGSISSPYVINNSSTITVDGSETKINQGSNINIAGTGTVANPYVINAIIPASAVQVNSDWSAISGPAQILNKPSIPSAQVNSDWNSVSGPSMILNKPALSNTNLGYIANVNGGQVTSSTGSFADIPLFDETNAGLMSQQVLNNISANSDNIKTEILIDMPATESNDSFAQKINQLPLFSVSANQIPIFKAVKLEGENPVVFYVELIGKGKGSYGLTGVQLSSQDVKVTSFVLSSGALELEPTTQVIELGVSAVSVLATINSSLPNIVIQNQESGYVIIKGTFNSQTYEEYLWIGAGNIYGSGATQAVLADLKRINDIVVMKAESNYSGTVKTNFTVADPVVYLKESTDQLLSLKQVNLISGTNIKTINGNSLLGFGDIILVTDISGKEDIANKSSSFTASSTVTYANTKALVDGLATKATGTGTANGANTGDETLFSLQTKRPLKTVEGQSLEGLGDISITPIVKSFQEILDQPFENFTHTFAGGLRFQNEYASAFIYRDGITVERTNLTSTPDKIEIYPDGIAHTNIQGLRSTTLYPEHGVPSFTPTHFAVSVNGNYANSLGNIFLDGLIPSLQNVIETDNVVYLDSVGAPTFYNDFGSSFTQLYGRSISVHANNSNGDANVQLAPNELNYGQSFVNGENFSTGETKIYPNVQSNVNKNFSFPNKSSGNYVLTTTIDFKTIDGASILGNGNIVTGGSFPAHIEYNTTDKTLWSNGLGNTDSNITYGSESLMSNTSGYFNTSVGHQSLKSNTSGFGNVSIGTQSMLVNTDGSQNVSIGERALKANLIGGSNTAIGSDALSNSIADFNTGIGSGSLSNNTSGNSNTALGLQSAINNTTGSNNTAVGYAALFFNKTGIENTSLGSSAGTYVGFATDQNILSNKSVYLGENCRAEASNQTNQIVIGYLATGSGSNTATLGNTSITRTILRGAVQQTGYTVASLPAGSQGMFAYVTDALAPTYMTAIVGGGAVVTPVFHNGTSWVAH